VTDDFVNDMTAVHDLMGPGPSLEGARVPVARKSLLRITHVLRAYQQEIDLSMLRLIERQWVESEELRRERDANRQAVADAHARVDELEARVEVLTALTDDLSLLVDRFLRDQSVISLADDGVVAQLAQRSVSARDGVIDATG
jgi:hypothetical protein